MISRELVWEYEHDADCPCWKAGNYIVMRIAKWIPYYKDRRFSTTVYPTESEAKAAAQRHSDECVARMLSVEAREALRFGLASKAYTGDHVPDIRILDRIAQEPTT